MNTQCAISVLNWQGWQDTVACLTSLKTLIFPEPIHIIVCDNGSADDSWSRILTWAEQNYSPAEIAVNPAADIPLHPFTLIQIGENRGFAGGHNVGIRYALETQFIDYLWLLNNDTVVDKNALTALWTCMQTHPEIALLGSTILNFAPPHRVQCAGGCRYFPLLTRVKNVLGDQTLDFVLNQPSVTLDYVYGASLFLRAPALKHVGLLNETYFLFYEELDYTQRLKRHGYQIGWCKHSFVYHKGSASVGSRQEGNRQKLQRANYYENLSTLKYTANFHRPLLLWVMIIRFVLKALAVSSRGDFYLLRPLVKAYWDFIKTSSKINIL